MNFNLVNAPKKLVPIVKVKLREQIPKLNERQLKRLKMKFSDAIIDEFEELKFKKALKLFKKILKIDEDHEKNFQEKINHKLLDKIFNALKSIEEKTDENEIESFLELINDIWNIDEKFDWLIEVLLIHASSLVTENSLENSKIDAIVKLVHGTAISEKLKFYRASVVVLESAFQIASKHDEWSYNSEKLCELISHQLSDSLTKLSRQLREDENDLEGALKLSIRSLKVLRKFIGKNSMIYEIEAESELAACHYEIGEFEKSLNHYQHALSLAEGVKLREKCCQILVKISECFESLKDLQKYENYLQTANEIAEELKLIELQGDISLKLGKHFSITEDSEKAFKFLKTAIKCYIKAENDYKIIHSKSILANFKAKSNFNALVDTILRCDKSTIGRNQDYEKLVLWYDRKYPLTNRHHEFYHIDDEDLNLNVFIKKFYDPDEITQNSIN